MEKLILFFTIFFFCGVAVAENYNLYNSDNYTPKTEYNEKILFIMDYSSSMEEYLNNKTKYETMLQTMKNILPKIPKHKQIGLRIYGHKSGITPYHACKASSLVVPIMPASAPRIERELQKYRPVGMTPITYSLKQAINSDMRFPEKKRIILLTDGGENCDESPCKWAMELIRTRKDINIDVIAFNMEDDDDLDQLKCTSAVTSGKFYNPKTYAELLDSLENSLDITKEVEGQIIRK